MSEPVDKPPKVEVFLTDKYEQEASHLYKKFNKEKTPPELLLQASELMVQSSNPEAKQISTMYKALYFREKGLKDNNDKRARRNFMKSLSEFKNVLPKNDVILKRVELEFLKRKLGSKLQRPDPKIILRRATLYKELGQIQTYNQEMSFYYMFLIMEQHDDDLGTHKTSELADKMLSHAQQGLEDELMFKIKALYHRIKANTVYNPKDRTKELEQAVAAIQKTTDRFGEDATQTEALMAKALSTTNKTRRNVMLTKVAKDYQKRGLKKRVNFVKNLMYPIPIKPAKIIYLCDKSLERIKQVEKKLVSMNPGKPSALFYHVGYLIRRIKDVQRVMMRMALTRKELTELQIKIDSLTPTKIIPGKPFAKRLQTASNKRDRLGEQMSQDMESLLIYGNLLLDQWSYIIGYLAGYEAPKTNKINTGEYDLNLAGLVNLLQAKTYSGELKVFWECHKKDIIWLFFNLRMYRNIFIEHMRKPWQLGTTMSTYGDDFSFHIPAPVGYIDETEKRNMLEDIYKLAPQRLKDMPDEYWEKKNLHRVLEVTLYYIEELENQSDRERVWNAWDKLGGSTPSYDTIGIRLMEYVYSSLDTIDEFIDKYPKLIKFGE